MFLLVKNLRFALMVGKKVGAFFVRLLLVFARGLIRLRYRLVIRGLESVKQEDLNPSGGILFLPNHPAEIDPVFLESILWPSFSPRPLVVEYFYRLRGFKWLMDLIRAMPLPTMDAGVNRFRSKRVENQFNGIVEGLKKQENFLIYPSGRLKITGAEMLGGASFVHKLVQTVPETNLVLVRTTGLWGSKFSKALTGSSPNFHQVLLECFKILLKNGIFFAPRRTVLIEFSLPPSDFPRRGNRLEFNQALENWYNRYPEVKIEPLKLISYSFWKEELPKVFSSAAASQKMKGITVSKKVQTEVFSHLSSLCGRPVDQIQASQYLSLDLGLDSLDLVQIYVFLDEHYEVTDLMPGDLQTVEDVLQFASGYKKQREEEGVAPRVSFPLSKNAIPPQMPPGETIQEVFLHRFKRSSSLIACVDALSGPLSYFKCLLAVFVLARKFRELPGDKVGVMLPSSSVTYLIIFALLFSKKVPVMLNWTAGVKSLNHAVDLTDLSSVITSLKFLDKLENSDLGVVESLFVFMEDVKEKITLKDKCAAFILSCLPLSYLLKKFQVDALKASDPAVILFTSGTESLPKGVPLSHANLLSNQRSALSTITIRAEDILYAVLPPFHSFGFSVTGVFPLLAGLKVCYAPDPTDSHGLARDIERYQPTLFCCAPSFIKALFRVADEVQLRSLRLVVSGAEKTPQDLFDYVQQHLPGAHLLEGYGITECSPIVTLDRLGEPHQGVGRAIPGVELMILDSMGMQSVPMGQEGEICIAGPGVFGGYLGGVRDPFILIQGKRWYLSGDRGYLDENNILNLSGRLKRFVKIGGEMVSLGGLEEELLRLAKEKQWMSGEEEGPPLAVSVSQKLIDKPMIILFTIFPISKEEVNAALKECGFSRLVKIAEVRLLDQIPLTGTGKTHYRLLDES